MMEPRSVPGAHSVLLYDGACGFCAESVQFVLRHEKRRVLHFAALDSTYGRAVLDRHPELRDVDTVVWLEPTVGDEPERVLVRSAAALEVANYLGGFWRLSVIARLVPSVVRDALYDVIARHRHHLGQAAKACLVPAAEDRQRFLS